MIYVDLDSTLNDFIEVVVEKCNELDNKNYKVEDILHWNHILELYPSFFIFMGNSPYQYIKPINKAKEFLNELKEIDDVCILTDTDEKMQEEKAKWIEKYFPNTKYMFTNGDKLKYVKDNDIIIDDKFETIYQAAKEGKWGILFRNNDKYTYNDCIYDHYKYCRCNTYQCIIETIKTIKERAK